MIYLSNAALKYAVNICEELPGYKVCISISKTSDLVSAYHFLVANININNINYKFSMNKSAFNVNVPFSKIEFNNSSLIAFIPANEFSKGYACNLLIADHNIDRRIITDCLLFCEKMDYYKYQTRENKDKQGES